MPTLAPYEFSDEDARHTIRLRSRLFDLLAPDGRARALVEPFRLEAEAAADQFQDGGAHDDALGEALEVVWRTWRDAASALRPVGHYGPTTRGSVVGLFRSDGGVPKLPVARVMVGWSGLDGDRQEDRANHGRPFQAVCLWSVEVIDAFVAAGHSLAPGRAGENITLRDIPWERVVPGSRLRVGPVLLEISTYTTPCHKNAAWFLGGHFDVMHHRHGPVSRVYATVLEPGAVAVGDTVVLEPDPGGS